MPPAKAAECGRLLEVRSRELWDRYAKPDYLRPIWADLLRQRRQWVHIGWITLDSVYNWRAALHEKGLDAALFHLLQDQRVRIEPWLTSLFQSEHLSLLVGSGLTHAVHHIAAGKPAAGMSGSVSEGRFKEKIHAAASASAKAAGRDQSNIEDRSEQLTHLCQPTPVFWPDCLVSH